MGGVVGHARLELFVCSGLLDGVPSNRIAVPFRNTIETLLEAIQLTLHTAHFPGLGIDRFDSPSEVFNDVAVLVEVVARKGGGGRTWPQLGRRAGRRE